MKKPACWELFLPVSLVQINLIFINNVHILCLSCNIKKSKTTDRLYWKEQKQALLCQSYYMMSSVTSALYCYLWFSPGIAVSSTNKTDSHNITEILLKVVLNTITLYIYTVTFSYHLLYMNRVPGDHFVFLTNKAIHYSYTNVPLLYS